MCASSKRGLLRYDKDKDAPGQATGSSVEKHLLQAFVVRGACLEVVGRIEVEQDTCWTLPATSMVLPWMVVIPAGTCLGAVWTAPRK